MYEHLKIIGWNLAKIFQDFLFKQQRCIIITSSKPEFLLFRQVMKNNIKAQLNTIRGDS